MDPYGSSFVNSHEELVVSAETRALLKDIAARLAAETPPQTILTCVQRVTVQIRPDAFEAHYAVLDPATRQVVMEIPVNRISQGVFAEWLLLQVGNTCASCLSFLIDGEVGLCMTCESRSIMELVRLRYELG